MKFGVVIFPGSNCERDAYYAVKDGLGEPVDYIWHQSTDVSGYDCIILPGGFSFGDYLRSGAVAKFSPVMASIQEFAKNGGKVLGICNGFQILTEAGLLPGALIANKNVLFLCKYVNVKIANADTAFTNRCKSEQILRIPIAHDSGNYYVAPDTLKEIEDNGQVILRYCENNGVVSEESNPNGSLNGIAGIVNKAGNVAGMMPHPERAVENLLGSTDGLLILRSIVESMN